MSENSRSNWKQKIRLSRERSPYLWWLIDSAVTELILETLSRKSILDAFLFMVDKPVYSAINYVMILFLYSLPFLFKRENFFRTLVTVFLMIIGVTDFILLFIRVTPFTAHDLLQINSAIRILRHYISWFAIVFAVLLAAAGIAALIIWFRKAPKRRHRRPLKESLPRVLITGAVSLLFLVTPVKNAILPNHFSNIADAYQHYGLIYCFATSALSTGIKKPADYSDEQVAEIVESEAETEAMETVVDEGEFPEVSGFAAEPTETVTDESGETLYGYQEGAANVIFVQLESFFDVTRLSDVTVSEDPIPEFHKLAQEYSTGYLSVPGVGAGTANTEFEVMTGLGLDFFGPGEYPYQTVLQNKTCESLAYVFSDLGYTSQAIHNNSALFYDRFDVFSQLGYDTFTSIEYMNNITWTETGWAEDSVLIPYIVGALRSTASKDYIYTISVQGHGSYPTEQVIDDPAIEVSVTNDDGTEDTDRTSQFSYYVNQIAEMDQFIRDLIGTLSAYPEPTVCVFYGDHLPALGIEKEDIEGGGNMFQTQYVIWDNFGLERELRDVESYQLGALVLQKVGISKGVLFRYHQNYLNNTEAVSLLADGGEAETESSAESAETDEPSEAEETAGVSAGADETGQAEGTPADEETAESAEADETAEAAETFAAEEIAEADQTSEPESSGELSGTEEPSETGELTGSDEAGETETADETETSSGSDDSGDSELSEEENAYLNGIAMLGYDMLYGDQSVYENGPYEPTDLKMGIDPIEITDVSFDQESRTLTVSGTNFTAYSIIVINGRQYTPDTWTQTELTLSGVKTTGNAEVCVAQLDDYGKAILSTTDTVTVQLAEE